MTVIAFPGIDGCSLPPIMYGTGYLYLVEGSNLRDLGNFSIVDWAGESSSRRIFRGTSEAASVVTETSLYRLTVSGDSYSIDQMARILNEETAVNGSTTTIALRTIREPSLYHVRFVRDLPEDGTCSLGQFQLDLWRCFIDPTFTYTFSQDEQTVHVITFVALPDVTDHPDNVFGELTEIAVS